MACFDLNDWLSCAVDFFFFSHGITYINGSVSVKMVAGRNPTML